MIGCMVVGFIGNDGSLGRTFYCDDHRDAMKAMQVLMAEYDDMSPDYEYWENATSLMLESGTYFYGGLELVDDED
jgi:hypothetical protein